MDDTLLTKISVVISLVGIAAIFVITQLITPQSVSVVEINDAMLGQGVQVEGTIEKFSANGGNVFIDLNDTTGRISVVMFERDARGQESVYDLKEGDTITVIGKISLYRAELEIIAASIKRF